MSPKLFRYTLIAYVALAIFGGIFDVVFPTALPGVLAHAQEANDTNLSSITLILLGILGLIVGVGGITATIGLYLFRPWAPRLAVVVTVLALFVWPLLGVDVASGWSVALTSLSTTLWGAILALAYFSPIKAQFVATR